MKKWLAFLITIAVAIVVLCILAGIEIKANTVYTITFYVDGEEYSEFSAKNGSKIEFPEVDAPDDENNVFVGWFTNQDYNIWYTATKLTKNVSVYGYWLPYEDSLVTITFYDDDGEIIEGYPLQIQIGDYIESYPLPDTDDGYRLDAWMVDDKPYDFSVRALTDLEFHPTRKPAEYTVEFISLGEVVATQIYTVENYNIKVPACPDREHYYPGEWESYELTMGDIKVNAVYEPITYTVEYIDGSNTVLAEYDYTILTYKDIVAPEPTPVPGCLSYFDDLECGETLLRQKVIILDYTIEYYVKDNLVATFYTDIIKFYQLVPPEIPEVAGYTSHWEEYKLRLETYIVVNAIYDPITYYVSFEAFDGVVEVLEYNVENTEVEAPDIPDRAGYTSEWEDFKLVIGDVTVNAQYTPIDYTASFILYDELIGTEYSLTYTTTFNAENMVINFPTTKDYPIVAGCDVKWDNPKLSFEDILINGYYYDVGYYTYLDFVQVKIVDYIVACSDEEPDNEDTDNEIEEPETEYEEVVLDHYFYVAGLAKNSGSPTNIIIPATYHNIPVRYIQEYAFANRKFTTLEIYGIEKIESYAFTNCEYLQSVILHDGIQRIDYSAFAYCYNLTTLKIPDTVTEIGESAFYASGLVTITLPCNLEIISENMFYHCDDLSKIVIPDSVKEISENAFIYCSKLTSVSLGSGVEVIRKSAFAHCTSLKEITIPVNTYSIESNAFNGCAQLEKIIILDGVWYYYYNQNIDSAQKVPEDILSSAESLAPTIVGQPDISLFKETA